MKEIYKLTINVLESETYRGMKSSHNFALQKIRKKSKYVPVHIEISLSTLLYLTNQVILLK